LVPHDLGFLIECGWFPMTWVSIFETVGREDKKREEREKRREEREKRREEREKREREREEREKREREATMKWIGWCKS
jgi:hypothetical protein